MINLSDRAGTVRIHAVADQGRATRPRDLALAAGATVHLTSRDLARGNRSLGFPLGLGQASKPRRLLLTTALSIEALAYAETADGSLSSLHDIAPEIEEGARRYLVPLFEPPGMTKGRRSWLRLVNPGPKTANVTISATDDRGRPAPLGQVRLTLAKESAQTLTAEDLEAGRRGLIGRTGDGEGRWRLEVAADRPVQVMSLLTFASGHLANVSRGNDAPALDAPPPPEPTTHPDLAVEIATVSDASPRPGALLTVSTHARNDGSAQAPATTVRLYRSTNPNISDNFEPVASEPLPSLAPAWRTPVSFAVYAPANPGTWSYTVCIDSVPGETETDNNCAPWTRIQVRAPTTLWGTIAAGWQGSSCAQSIGWYFTTNYPSKTNSEDTALSGCHGMGLNGCLNLVDLQAVRRPRLRRVVARLQAIYGAYGDTRYAAEQAALRRCRADYLSCEVPQDASSGVKASLCNDSATAAALSAREEGDAHTPAPGPIPQGLAGSAAASPGTAPEAMPRAAGAAVAEP